MKSVICDFSLPQQHADKRRHQLRRLFLCPCRLGTVCCCDILQHAHHLLEMTLIAPCDRGIIPPVLLFPTFSFLIMLVCLFGAVGNLGTSSLIIFSGDCNVSFPCACIMVTVQNHINLCQLILSNAILTFLCCFRLVHCRGTCVEC